MSALEDFPGSEYARNKAARMVAESLAYENLTERICALIANGHTGIDAELAIEEHPGEWPLVVEQDSFQHGVLVAVDVLIRAGLTEEKMPIDGLKDLVMRVSLGADAFMEAQYETSGGDIRNLYIVEDGGNG